MTKILNFRHINGSLIQLFPCSGVLSKLGKCDILSVPNYLVWFKSNQYEYWPNTENYNLVNYLFFAVNIHLDIGQIVYNLLQIFQKLFHFLIVFQTSQLSKMMSIKSSNKFLFLQQKSRALYHKTLYNCNYCIIRVWVLTTVCQFHPSLIFVGKCRNLPLELQDSTQVCSCLGATTLNITTFSIMTLCTIMNKVRHSAEWHLA